MTKNHCDNRLNNFYLSKKILTVLSYFLITITLMFSMVFSEFVTSEQVSESKALSKPIERGENYEIYGAPMSDKVDGISLTQLIEGKIMFLDHDVRVTTNITQVCQAKGCFFVAVENENWARVTFRDYEFFIPTDSVGFSATIIGHFTEKSVSADQVKHYSDDLGEQKMVNEVTPSIEYSIVASSVLINRLNSEMPLQEKI